MNAFEIVRTRAELVKFAVTNDGMCKVVKTRNGALAVPPDKELGSRFGEWDYYMCDEPDSFDFEKYGISK